ncbi:MAG: hypothetical protein HXY34_00885 [Candidatus Thorarchaeota archaeon]|nr:hypothetical protein [Candidatus Thorarchaeota archaeon]
MTYSVLKLIEIMGGQFSLLLTACLNRYPILVVGQDAELVDDVVTSAGNLSPHRHRLVFWRDFTTESEILAAWEEEKHDYEVTRTTVCCYSSSLRLALDRIRCFNGWILAIPLGTCTMGIKVTDGTVTDVQSRVLQASGNCGVLRVTSPSVIEFQLLKPVEVSMAVEKSIVNKILSRKHQSLERIRRLLGKSLRGLDVADGLSRVILDLGDEAEKITKDMFEEEVSAYVHAARRAVTILSRIRVAREMGAPSALTERSLFEAIGWETGDICDLTRFIGAEWHEDFSDCVKGGTLSGVGAWVDSMWGT